MKYEECMIAYDPNSNRIRVGPWPDRRGWSDDYIFTVGACFMLNRQCQLTRDQLLRRVQLLLEFHHAVVRDAVPFDEAHKAFLQIDEYRDMMAHDVPSGDQA
jgi:hypothetical protein